MLISSAVLQDASKIQGFSKFLLLGCLGTYQYGRYISIFTKVFKDNVINKSQNCRNQGLGCTALYSVHTNSTCANKGGEGGGPASQHTASWSADGVGTDPGSNPGCPSSWDPGWKGGGRGRTGWGGKIGRRPGLGLVRSRYRPMLYIFLLTPLGSLPTMAAFFFHFPGVRT
jgi:hypothetical protein